MRVKATPRCADQPKPRALLGSYSRQGLQTGGMLACRLTIAAKSTDAEPEAPPSFVPISGSSAGHLADMKRLRLRQFRVSGCFDLRAR